MFRSIKYNKVFFMLAGMVVFIIGSFLIGVLTSYKYGISMLNTMFIEGMILVVIGALSMMKGNPSAVDMSDIGQSQPYQYNMQVHFDAVRQERETTEYYNRFTKHAIVKFSLSGTTLIISGILIIFMGCMIG